MQQGDPNPQIPSNTEGELKEKLEKEKKNRDRLRGLLLEIDRPGTMRGSLRNPSFPAGNMIQIFMNGDKMNYIAVETKMVDTKQDLSGGFVVVPTSDWAAKKFPGLEKVQVEPYVDSSNVLGVGNQGGSLNVERYYYYKIKLSDIDGIGTWGADW